MGQQKPYCGYPGFNLSCDQNGRSILNLSDQNYVVRQIFYQNHSLIVSNPEFSTPAYHGCMASTLVLLLYNCPSSSLGTLLKNRIGCYAGNDTSSVVAVYENDKDRLVNASGKCGTEAVVAAVAVVAGYRKRGEDEDEGIVTREVLGGGFLLHWEASDCSYCESTGGRCGFNETSYHFKCYCPDRPHAARCNCDPSD
ncbi:Wall-associated receptor kinase, C-terminal [Parasponia andersonii]|uniref:non-specific serine/threonine protein kinase n=1 Tax=Parasponia andersonii TaxID=3476 RepID=A0A2P5DZG7_PARAD|nr:Wall-associated receptor kinase, C-terminal [Parasponia andersonii]